MKKTTLDYWVGVFVVLGFAALLFLALKAGNMSSFSFQETYTVTAQFDNIGGLKPRAPIKSAGVVVGRVASIRLDDKNYMATVELNLDKRYQFPKDTSAKILTSGLLGEQYIGLEAGGDTAMLAQGGKITMTQSAVVLENLIGQFLYNKAADAGAGGGSTSSGSGAGALPAAPGTGGSGK
ncbi:phospholipid/cholesterol/gamma-HCH transport system substrate-binding protein [Cupriavidus metallidurans]|jgi:phospholipid/cholesterol/gamma-HCH transport system substrate-binding protein|uniref:Toluene transporter subunit: membrane component of ABC superfamily n=1 Tax=Cupriavidus metallidurans (strain ATCC 43123 / DSM 2839 / NBRC 102507 / CH34) TaxID=266264 RepID=Q1LI97_CUPMC|nr:outer membrane lipid asymmetry maintenance protein MlaD [Cupriavidus metallidurans]ABF10129.1 toluene transporter subunit: membrane component of ABC superfamily [Cupriavidus metallidurans CH34]KWW39925.1 putative phospholipid ABC transporter-binding protein MlaD [Cupriavidus metallidurans]MDE4919607.1 outer membrane lipid asymmetry maintenance protein MlaD [Cupriavidus metallidurans]QGS29075.1 outer membrane lipid asymmetry maintenance protein MlaD [Cupriavidus metallidurans]UBM10693.1 oute